MSTIAADVLDRSPYATPEAELRITGEPIEDKFFGAEGRIGVLRYNARVFQGAVIMIAAYAVMLGAVVSENIAALLITIVPCIIASFAGYAVMVYSAIKRLHDLDLSGWFYLVGYIPLVGAIFQLYYVLKPAKQDDNRFGTFREATNGDKVMGILGLLMSVGFIIVGMINMIDMIY